jgi:hypothetical protein
LEKVTWKIDEDVCEEDITFVFHPNIKYISYKEEKVVVFTVMLLFVNVNKAYIVRKKWSCNLAYHTC